MASLPFPTNNAKHSMRRRLHNKQSRVRSISKDQEEAETPKQSHHLRQWRKQGLVSIELSFILTAITIFATLSLVNQHLKLMSLSPSENRSSSILFHSSFLPNEHPLSLWLPTDFVSTRSFYWQAFREDKDTIDPDYGDLQISFRGKRKRRITRNDASFYEDERARTLDDSSFYYTKHKYRNDEDFLGEQECYRNNWRSKMYPVCNILHESTIGRRLDGISQEYDISYLGHGYYRDAWLFRRTQSNDSLAMKKLRLNSELDVDLKHLLEIQKEAIIMERLTASPRTVDIHGYCGISILMEHMLETVTHNVLPHMVSMKQAKLDDIQRNDFVARNNLTAIEKLDLAITMAESIADLHGFSGGMIAHGDIWPDQWLYSASGAVKLNDFNKGEIFDYDTAGDGYCRVKRCYDNSFKSPEELNCEWCNEKSDIYCLGNTIYILLTGLWPFYGEERRSGREGNFAREMIASEKIQLRPYFDARYRNRSIIEGKLVDIMEQCWEWDFRRRISIFEVVKRLREVKAAYNIS